MFNWIVCFSLGNRLFVLVAALLLVAYGTFMASCTPVDVFPALDKPLVTVLTEAGGMALEEVEQQVSFPIEMTLNWWADGIHTGVRSENADGQCVLVIVGVTPEGRKERVAIADGFREATASWREVLLDLKARGLQAGPLLAVGDGAMGFWAALEEVFTATQAQRCWFHKLGNMLNALPASQQAGAKAAMQDIFMAATRADALVAFAKCVTIYSAKYPKAVEKLTQDRDSLLAFYDFPAEHWQHVRTTNPIESTFATMRHRTTRARHCLSRATFLGLAFKLMEEAEKSWHKIRGADRMKPLLDGVTFKDGIPGPGNPLEQQALAA